MAKLIKLTLTNGNPLIINTAAIITVIETVGGDGKKISEIKLLDDDGVYVTESLDQIIEIQK